MEMDALEMAASIHKAHKFNEDTRKAFIDAGWTWGLGNRFGTKNISCGRVDVWLRVDSKFEVRFPLKTKGTHFDSAEEAISYVSQVEQHLRLAESSV